MYMVGGNDPPCTVNVRRPVCTEIRAWLFLPELRRRAWTQRAVQLDGRESQGKGYIKGLYEDVYDELYYKVY